MVAIIGIGIGARYAEIANSQLVRHVRKLAEFEMATVVRRSFAMEAPRGFRHRGANRCKQHELSIWLMFCAGLPSYRHDDSLRAEGLALFP